MYIQAKDGVESLTLVLEHAIGDREFSERGVASVRSLKSSATAMSLSQNILSHAQLDEIKVYTQKTAGTIFFCGTSACDENKMAGLCLSVVLCVSQLQCQVKYTD